MFHARSGLYSWRVGVLQSCLMCVSCHPEMPSVVAGGSFNGEVLVWDTNRDEPLVASSRIDDYFHREAITQVSWFFDLHRKEYLVRVVLVCTSYAVCTSQLLRVFWRACGQVCRRAVPRRRPAVGMPSGADRQLKRRRQDFVLEPAE